MHTIRGKGAVLRSSISENVTPEKVRDAWAKVIDMKNATHIESITEATGTLVELLDGMNIDQPESVAEYTDEFSFNNKDLILYALGSELKCHL